MKIWLLDYVHFPGYDETTEIVGAFSTKEKPKKRVLIKVNGNVPLLNLRQKKCETNIKICGLYIRLFWMRRLKQHIQRGGRQCLNALIANRRIFVL